MTLLAIAILWTLLGLLMMRAVPPLSPDRLRETADLIVIARVLSVGVSQPTASRDESYVRYTMELEVTRSEKGRVKRGSVLTATTFRPAPQPVARPGHQGQNQIPDVGSTIRAYLSRTSAEQFVFLLPNGIEIAPVRQDTVARIGSALRVAITSFLNKMRN